MSAPAIAPDAGAQIVPSVSIENLLQKRAAIADRALAIDAARLEAEALYRSIDPNEVGRHGPSVQLEISRGRSEFSAPDYMKAVDASLWAHLLAESGLRTFMDTATRAEWDTSIASMKIPELTRANIEATFARLYASRGEMFEQGVLRLVRSLSWDYKTNQPHKFGKRLVMTSAVTYYKRSSTTDCYGVDHHAANRLDDLIRVLSVVDGKPEPDHRAGAWRTLNDAGWMRNSGGSMVQTAVLPYLAVKGFKNGNAHLTFTSPALVEHLNRIIAKHFPAALPPSREAA